MPKLNIPPNTLETSFI